MNDHSQEGTRGRARAAGLVLGALVTCSAAASAGEPEAHVAQAAPPAQPGAAYPATAYPPHFPPPQQAPPAPARSAPMVVYDWDPDVPAPQGYALDSDPNWGLVGGGIGLLAAGWTLSVLTAAVAMSVEENEEDDLAPGEQDDVSPSDWSPLYIPVVGPFVGIGTLEASGSGLGLLVADGIVQAAGLLGILLGSLDPDYKVIRVSSQIDLEVGPAVGRRLQGLSVKGSF